MVRSRAMSTRTLPAETAAPPRSRDVGALELLRFLAGPLRYLEGLRDGRDVVPFRLGGERAHLVLDPELAANDEPALEAPAEIAVARIRLRAEGWVEGQPLELYGELRALCGAIAWEALTGTDLDAAPGMLEAVKVRPLGPPWPPGRRDARKLDFVLGL